MSDQTTPADPDVFDTSTDNDESLTEDDLLGTHTYEDVVYAGDYDLDSVIAGNPHERLTRDTKRARYFAAMVGKDAVAKPSSGGSIPFSALTFYNHNITGSTEFENVTHNAVKSDAYEVSYCPNYETGTLKITVKRSI